MVNQFQRLIDPATVRSQDIELYRDALSTMANLEVAFIRVGQGGFLPDNMIDGMMEVAKSLHSAQRDFVSEEVGSAIGVWNTLHPEFSLSGDDSKFIAENIIGGKKNNDADSENALDRARRVRGGG